MKAIMQLTSLIITIVYYRLTTQQQQQQQYMPESFTLLQASAIIPHT